MSVIQCLLDHMLTLITVRCKVNYYWLIVDLISRRRPLYYIVYSSTRQHHLDGCGYWRSQLITAFVPEEEEENSISPQIELSTHITGSKVFRHLFSGQSHLSVISGTPSSDNNKQCYKLSIEVSIVVHISEFHRKGELEHVLSVFYLYITMVQI